MRPELAASKLVGKPKVLLVYGSGDPYTPIAFGQRLQAAMSGCADCELLSLPGVTHTFALKEAPETYRNAVLPFLAKSLQIVDLH